MEMPIVIKSVYMVSVMERKGRAEVMFGESGSGELHSENAEHLALNHFHVLVFAVSNTLRSLNA